MGKARGVRRVEKEKDKIKQQEEKADDQVDSSGIIDTQFHQQVGTSHQLYSESRPLGQNLIQGDNADFGPEIIRKRAGDLLEKGPILQSRDSGKDKKRQTRSETQNHSQLLGSSAFLRNEHFIHIRKDDHDQTTVDRQRNTARATKRGRSIVVPPTKAPSPALNEFQISATTFKHDTTVATTNDTNPIQFLRSSPAETSERPDSQEAQYKVLSTTDAFLEKGMTTNLSHSDTKKDDHILFTSTTSTGIVYEECKSPTDRKSTVPNESLDTHIPDSFSGTTNLLKEISSRVDISTLHANSTLYDASSHLSTYSFHVEKQSQKHISPTTSSVNLTAEPTEISFCNEKIAFEIETPWLNLKPDIPIHLSTGPLIINDSATESLTSHKPSSLFHSHTEDSSKLDIATSTINYRLEEQEQQHTDFLDAEGHALIHENGLDTGISCEEHQSIKPETASSQYLLSNHITSLDNEATPSKIENLLQSHKLVNEIKIKLLLEGSNVHHGQGADRLFANYWDSLGRYLSAGTYGTESIQTNRCCADVDFNGIESVLKSFLCTKKLRTLHNQLILGLMKQSNHNFVLKSTYQQHVPLQWMKHKTDPVEEKKDPIHTITAMNRNDPLEGLNGYLGILSGAWTASGDINPVVVHANSSTLRINSVPNRLMSPTVPGVLEISSIVSRASKNHDIKMSDTAIDFLAVAVKEQVALLLRRAISSIEQTTPQGCSSILADNKGSPGKVGDAGTATDARRSSIQGIMNREKRIISPLALASAVEIHPFGIRSSDPTTQRFSWERCLFSANGSLP